MGIDVAVGAIVGTLVAVAAKVVVEDAVVAVRRTLVGVLVLQALSNKVNNITAKTDNLELDFRFKTRFPYSVFLTSIDKISVPILSALSEV